jgi:hypothetical protein
MPVLQRYTTCILTKPQLVLQLQIKSKKKYVYNVDMSFFSKLKQLQKTNTKYYVTVLYFSLYFFRFSLKYQTLLFNVEQQQWGAAFYQLYFTNNTMLNSYTKTGVAAKKLQNAFFTLIAITTIYKNINNYCNLYQLFFKKSGNSRIRMKRQFPSINIAFRFKISEYVIY